LHVTALTGFFTGLIAMGKELRQLWEGLPNKAEFAVLVAAWVLLFHFLGNSTLGYVDTASMFTWLNALHESAEKADTDDAFGRYVPLLVLVLLIVRRQELTEAAKRSWVPGVAIVVLALLLHAAGFLVQQTRVSIVAFFVGLYGIMGLLWGPGWLRAVFFPYFLLAFTLPVTAYLDAPTFKLRLFSTWFSTWFCKSILSIPIKRIGTMVYKDATAKDPGFQFDVAAACSGIRSLTIVLLLTLAFAWLHLRSPWRRCVMILAAVPLALLGNTVRLITTFCVADIWGQAAASKVETKAGFITFAVALAGVFALGRVLNDAPPAPPGSNPEPEPEPEPDPLPRTDSAARP
jgi:exosortase